MHHLVFYRNWFTNSFQFDRTLTTVTERKVEMETSENEKNT